MQTMVTPKKCLENFKPKWNIMLDPVKLQFYMEPCEEEDQPIYCVKTISLEQLNKFGRDIFATTFPILPGNIMKCAVSKCRRWLNGVCFKHPLIFVKEHPPSTTSYNAKDTFPEFLYLAESKIPNAGLGVFSRILIPAGVVFGPYAGIITRGLGRTSFKYVWQKLRLDWSEVWIDAEEELMSNWMRYVNSSRWEEEQNIVSCFFHGQLYYTTYKSITPDAELLTWYGENYGSAMGINVDYPDDYPDRNTSPPKKMDAVVRL